MVHANPNDFAVMLNPQSRNAENVGKWISEHMDARTDPASKTPCAPPLYGQDAVPHLLTFQSIVGSFSRAYVNPDEAMRDSIENAHLMEKDVGLLESVECRQRLTALLDWEIKPEDEKCQYQVSLAQELQRIISRIRNFTKYRMWLMKAIWSGRSGIQHKYGYTRVNGAMRMMPTPLHRDHNGWMPINGDKLVFRYEDGWMDSEDGAYPHQMGIRVGTNPGKGKMRIHRDYKLEPVSDGLALFLKPYERDTFCVHKHFIEDADFHHSYFAGSVHGIGIRSKIYWEWFLKQEAFAFLMQYLERSAGGIEVWTYPMGDPKALAATQAAAKEKMANGRNIVFFPKPMGDDSESYKFEVIEPGAMGLDIMQNIIENYFGGRLKRYILGQELSTEAKATGMGSGVAEAHMDTLSQIVQFDASNLEETLTHELVRYIQQLNFPETMGWHMRMSLKTKDDKTQERLEALNAAYQMGASIAESEVFKTLGLSAPTSGEKVLSMQSQQPAMGMPGMPGMPPMGGIPDGDNMGQGMPEDGGNFPDGENEDDGEQDPVDLIRSLMEQYAQQIERERYGTQGLFKWEETLHPRESSTDMVHKAGQFTSKKTAPQQKSLFEGVTPAAKQSGRFSGKPRSGRKALNDRIRSLFAEHAANKQTANDADAASDNDGGIFGKAPSSERALPTLDAHGKFIKSKTEDEQLRERIFAIAKGSPPSVQHVPAAPVPEPKPVSHRETETPKAENTKETPVQAPRPQRELSDQEESLREYAENFANVSADPPKATSRNLHRATGFIRGEIKHHGRRLEDGRINQDQHDGLVSSLKAEHDWYDDILRQRGDLAGGGPYSDEKNPTPAPAPPKRRMMGASADSMKAVAQPAAPPVQPKPQPQPKEVATPQAASQHIGKTVTFSDGGSGKIIGETASQWKVAVDGGKLKSDGTPIEVWTFMKDSQKQHNTPNRSMTFGSQATPPKQADPPSVETVPQPTNRPAAAAQPVNTSEQVPTERKPGALTPEQSDLVSQHLHLIPKAMAIVAASNKGFIVQRDRESAMSEAQFKLVEAAQKFDPSLGKPFESFALTNMTNHGIKNLKRRKLDAITSNQSGDDETDPLANVAGRSKGDQSDMAATSENTALLQKALSTLPENEAWLFNAWINPPLNAEGTDRITHEEITQQYYDKFGTKAKGDSRQGLGYRIKKISKKLKSQLPQDLYSVVREFVIRYYRREIMAMDKDRYERRQDRTIREAAEYTETDPTDAQIKAGNYKKGRFSWNGMQIVIENPRGSVRRGVSGNGSIWRRDMTAHYGYISGTKGTDGDQVDVFMGRNPESEVVFVICQTNADGSFDEHKCVLGTTNERKARDLYLSHYPKGWKCGEVKAMTVKQFKEWVDSGECCHE